MFFRKLGLAIKRNKLWYYTINIGRQIIPDLFYRVKLKNRLKDVYRYEVSELKTRVDYYNKLERPTESGNDAIALKDIRVFESPKAYNFDTVEFTRFFNSSLRANFLFGDVTHAANVPSIQKSRPVVGNNANAILLKLDKKRHFLFLDDRKHFSSKKNMLVGRAAIFQQHRVQFMEMYFNHPLCDLGQININGGNVKWLKPKLNILSHLNYKFILSLEGNDVATNLKWIMSSHSIAVMPRPKFETWFMEGSLVPDFHYILIKDDYSDLEEKLRYYIDHESAALEIVKNANEYVRNFKDKRKENLLSLLVLQKYFYATLQIDEYKLLNL